MWFYVKPFFFFNFSNKYYENLIKNVEALGDKKKYELIAIICIFYLKKHTHTSL